MKKIFGLLMIIISLSVSAQNSHTSSTSRSFTISEWTNDTLAILDTSIKVLKIGEKTVSIKDLFKKDTVAIPLYIIQKTDTSDKVAEMIIEGKKGRLYRIKGHYVFNQQYATTDRKKYQPIGQPVVIGAIDEKKKPVKLFRQ